MSPLVILALGVLLQITIVVIRRRLDPPPAARPAQEKTWLEFAVETDYVIGEVYAAWKVAEWNRRMAEMSDEDCDRYALELIAEREVAALMQSAGYPVLYDDAACRMRAA